jgi:hypothetical protein
MNAKKKIKKLKDELKSLKFRIQLDHDAVQRQLSEHERVFHYGDPKERVSD